MNKTPLNRIQIILVIAQAVLAVGFLVIGLVTSGSSEGWADLVRVAVAALAGSYFVGATVSGLAARFLVDNNVARILILLAGPPLVLMLFILFVRTW